MTLREKLMHYTNGLDNVDLKQEAITTIEHIAQYMDEDELLHHSRPLAIAYLALTEDASVPVVRCKDCKYADTERRNATEKRYYNSILFCRNSNLCNDEPLAMWPVDFCSYGVAKECADDES